MKPTISIVTVVKNNAHLIEDTINSVLSQSYPNIEYIIVDGNSTDGTTRIIKKHEGRISKWISEPDNGIYDALNKGIKLSSGDVLGFLHSDDIFADEKVIEKIAGNFYNGKAGVVYSDLVYVNRNNTKKIVRYWKAGEFSKNSLMLGWMPPHPTLFISRLLFEKYGLFSEKFKIASDYDHIIKIFKNCLDSISYISEVMIKMRTGGRSNKGFKNIIKKSAEDYKILTGNGFHFPAFTLLLKNIRKIRQFF